MDLQAAVLFDVKTADLSQLYVVLGILLWNQRQPFSLRTVSGNL